MKAFTLIPTIGLLLIQCASPEAEQQPKPAELPVNVLDFVGTPDSSTYRSSLVFSDQGAWFGYGFPADRSALGFSGPFLMTQENGVWLSDMLSELQLMELGSKHPMDFKLVEQTAHSSHFFQRHVSAALTVEQTLLFASAKEALISTTIHNNTEEELRIQASWLGDHFLHNASFSGSVNSINIEFDGVDVHGLVQLENKPTRVNPDAYNCAPEEFILAPKDSILLHAAHSFWFGKDTAENVINSAFANQLQLRIAEKHQQFERVSKNLKDHTDSLLAAKALLTLQCNWRSAAGALPHDGLFPSYHYKWFNGFWAWDSWKHAAGLALFDTELAKAQIRAMYAFQEGNGFIPDCVFRDTTVEKHNYRDTKPPLSAWAIWKIYAQDQDRKFLEDLFPKVLAQHRWWYAERDHDQDGLCEYGSTDGTLVAAKWESGMDNAVRFDQSQILQNSENAFSLDQESVDLNAYLYAEKRYLEKMANALGQPEVANKWKTQADTLKNQIQTQFFDAESGWFYDTSLDGSEFIKVKGCEGWIPLWANAATKEQAAQIKTSMLDPEQFNTYVPLPTLTSAHPKFNPERGYWRGPVWLDQAQFGIEGLRNYGYDAEANELREKLLTNAEGLLQPGPSIRENYNPLTGQGLGAENFSWSASHYLLLLQR